MSRAITLTPGRVLLATLALFLAAIAGFVVANPPSVSPAGAIGAASSGQATGADLAPTIDDIALAADTTTPQVAANRPIRGLLGLIGRIDRAEIQVTTAQGAKSILYVRGTVAAISDSSLTMTLRDGSSQAFTIDGSTILREDGKAEPVSTLTAGERAMVFGLKNADGSWTARLIRCVKAPAATGATGGAPARPAPSAGTLR